MKMIFLGNTRPLLVLNIPVITICCNTSSRQETSTNSAEQIVSYIFDKTDREAPRVPHNIVTAMNNSDILYWQGQL